MWLGRWRPAWPWWSGWPGRGSKFRRRRHPDPEAPQVVRETSPPAPAPPSLRQGFAEAGEAVVALTRRAAAGAVGEGRQLLPEVPVPAALTAPPLGPAFDVAAGPLTDARQALAEGFEPVATSAPPGGPPVPARDLPLPAEKD